MKEGYDEIDAITPSDSISQAKQDATVEAVLTEAFHGKYAHIAKNLAQASLLFGMMQITEEEKTDGITTEELRDLAIAVNTHMFFEIN